MQVRKLSSNSTKSSGRMPRVKDPASGSRISYGNTYNL